MKPARHLIIPAILLPVTLLLTSCGDDYSAAPTVAPRIVAFSPAEGATSVNVTTGIQVDFSEKIDRATVTEANFYLLNPLPAHYVVDGPTARMVLDDSLAFNTTYTVVVTRGIRATNDEPLEEGRSWSFTTAAKPLVARPPEITSFTPTEAYAGVELTITGHNFWWISGYNLVYINGEKATVQSADSTRLVCIVPEGATTGVVKVQTPSGTAVTSNDLLIYQPGDVWAQVPAPTDYSLSAVCWTGERFVAVGNLGTIVTSDSGLDWTLRSSGTINRLNAVIATGSRVVVVGTGGTVLTSPDGIVWQPQQSDTILSLYGLAYGSRLVAVGADGLIIWSDDAVAWQPVMPFTGQWLYDTAVTTHGYLAVGHDGTMAVSTTATSWCALDSVTSEHLMAARQVGATTIVVGYNGTILTSSDLSLWNERVSGTTSHLGGITSAGSQIVVVGDEGTILISPTGTNWQLRDSPTSLALNGIAWSGRRLAAVGDSGCILLSPCASGLSEVSPGASPEQLAF